MLWENSPDHFRIFHRNLTAYEFGSPTFQFVKSTGELSIQEKLESNDSSLNPIQRFSVEEASNCRAMKAEKQNWTWISKSYITKYFHYRIVIFFCNWYIVWGFFSTMNWDEQIFIMYIHKWIWCNLTIISGCDCEYSDLHTVFDLRMDWNERIVSSMFWTHFFSFIKAQGIILHYLVTFVICWKAE